MKRIVPILFFVIICLDGVAQVSELPKADSIAGLFPNHSLNDLNVLSQKLTAPLKTDEGKFRAIYKWVCLNIENDYALAEVNLSKRSTLEGEELEAWSKQFTARAMHVLITQHKTICTGYAYLVCELARRAGFKCEIVDGYGRGSTSNIRGKIFPNHSWNAVLLNGKWRLCDPTWSSGVVSAATKGFIQKFEECYFLPDPELFVRNHYPLDKKWTLLDDPPSLEMFLNAPVIYANAFRYNVRPCSPEAFRVSASKGENVSFDLVSKGKRNDVTVRFLVGNAIAQSRVPYCEGGYRVNHTFTRRGKFGVHFTVDNEYVASYEVTVR